MKRPAAAAVPSTRPRAPRTLRPRATASLSVAAALVTDLTAPVVLGLEAWQFRQLVKDENIAHARVGQRVIAQVIDVVAAVARLGQRQAEGEAPDGESLPAPAAAYEEPTPTADAILARIGRVRRVGRGT